MSLHALAYCPRLFYLENVEKQRVANSRVFAGRELHASLASQPHDSIEGVSERLGIQGRIDYIRSEAGRLIPVEVKRGRARRSAAGLESWRADEVQLGAYAMLVEELTGGSVQHGRMYYGRDDAWVRVPISDALRAAVLESIDQAQALATSLQRPPVAENTNLCPNCSLVGVCLPDEERVEDQRRLAAPPEDDRQILHVVEPGSRVGRVGLQFSVRTLDGEETKIPSTQTRSLVLHGSVQITSHAIRLSVDRSVGVHWLSGGGKYLGSLVPSRGNPTRRIRQYQALLDPETRLRLVRALVKARLWGQYRYLMRASRGRTNLRSELKTELAQLKRGIRQAEGTDSVDTIRGIEGSATKAYHAGLRRLVSPDLGETFASTRRSRRPARDGFNTLLNFRYSILLSQVANAIIVAGLDPHLGFYHTDRSSAPPLVLDLIELFRVPVWDVALIGALNRRTWDEDQDFHASDSGVWLTTSGRRKAIEVLERRLADKWRHPSTRHSISYAQAIELELQLLEKEWSGAQGLFAQARLR